MRYIHVGVAAEGDTDLILIEELIVHITKNENVLIKRLQPSGDSEIHRSNGWRGVGKWCQEDLIGGINEYINGIDPKLDYLIIQLDGDVSREGLIFCPDQKIKCKDEGKASPLDCKTAYRGDCPIDGRSMLPAVPISIKVEFLRKKICEWIGGDDCLDKVIICIPCDNLETWILAAYNGEQYHHPPQHPIESWENPAAVIAHKKSFCGIEIPRKGSGKLIKNKVFYSNVFVPKVIEEWDRVKAMCEQAAAFERDILQK